MWRWVGLSMSYQNFGGKVITMLLVVDTITEEIHLYL
jgi:hypothetical protein